MTSAGRPDPDTRREVFDGHGDARDERSSDAAVGPQTLSAPEPDGTRTGVWAGGVSRSADGALRVAGHDLRDVAATHGTPLYVLDEADLRARAADYARAFADAFAELAGADVYYAGKAFLSVAVARWVHEEGLRIDTATGGELAVALRAGVPGPHLGLHGNNKSAAEIGTALRAGAGRIVVDSLPEIELVAAIAHDLGVRAPVMVRVTTGVHAGGHEFIATAHEDQKFGLSLASGAARAAVDAVLARPALELVGLHSHIGSQILDLAGFEVAAQALLGLRAQVAAETGVLVPEVDLGGGYGVAYTAADGPPPQPEQIARALADVVGRVCAELGTPAPRISVEPGRSIVGPTTLTLYTVGTVKPVELDGGGRRLYVSVDGGMSDNLRPALYGARYTAAVASRTSQAELVTARVVGKHCESGDIVVRDVALPADVRAGDLLAVPVTGAYGRSMASNYNLVPRPAVLAVGEWGVRVIVRGETVEDLLALDLG